MARNESKPDQRYLLHLDRLRREGITNRFGDGVNLTTEFPDLSPSEARRILAWWINRQGIPAQ